jgi:hypothetical protein
MKALVTGHFHLGGGGLLTRGYEAGNVYAAEYKPQDLEDDERLEDDLGKMLSLYSVLVAVRDALVGDSDREAGGGNRRGRRSAEGNTGTRERALPAIRSAITEAHAKSAASTSRRRTVSSVPGTSKLTT